MRANYKKEAGRRADYVMADLTTYLSALALNRVLAWKTGAIVSLNLWLLRELSETSERLDGCGYDTLMYQVLRERHGVDVMARMRKYDVASPHIGGCYALYYGGVAYALLTRYHVSKGKVNAVLDCMDEIMRYRVVPAYRAVEILRDACRAVGIDPEAVAVMRDGKPKKDSGDGRDSDMG